MANIGDAAVAPIKRQAVSEQVVQRLVGLIQAGNLTASEQLPPERELAETLGVSRPSLREALRALSLLGLLDIRHGGGVYVSSLEPEALLGPLHMYISLDKHSMRDLLEARSAIEADIARLAAKRISDELAEQLKINVEAQKSATEDRDRFHQLDAGFHDLIAEATGNSVMIRILKSLYTMTDAGREVTGRIPGLIKVSLRDHRRIFRAIYNREPEAAAKAMAAHLDGLYRAYAKRTGADARKQ